MKQLREATKNVRIVDCSGWDSNRTPFECNSEMLIFEPNWFYFGFDCYLPTLHKISVKINWYISWLNFILLFVSVDNLTLNQTLITKHIATVDDLYTPKHARFLFVNKAYTFNLPVFNYTSIVFQKLHYHERFITSLHIVSRVFPKPSYTELSK